MQVQVLIRVDLLKHLVELTFRVDMKRGVAAHFTIFYMIKVLVRHEIEYHDFVRKLSLL